MRLISAADGQIVLTIQNSYPVIKYEVGGFNTPGSMEEHMNRVVKQMDADLKKALKG